jgi:uncharacterized protein YbaA (DUF1428 family)
VAYIDGFVLAVPIANRQRFIEHAKKTDAVFLEHGATRVLECWGDDVPAGKQTDFRRAVQAKDDDGHQPREVDRYAERRPSYWVGRTRR